MVRIFKPTSVPSFEIGLALGVSGCLQDTRSRVGSLRKTQNASDLKSQSIEANNCCSSPLYHVKAVFFPFCIGHKSIWKTKHSNFSIHWNALLVLSYVFFYCVHMSSFSLLFF